MTYTLMNRMRTRKAAKKEHEAVVVALARLLVKTAHRHVARLGKPMGF